jgi:hypothetical protein
MEWKWSKGEPYERSRRIIKKNEDNYNTSSDTAYSSALNHDENTWEIMNQSCASNDFKTVNKREELDFKIADRGLVQQIGINPFLVGGNYSDDIAIRDQYMKPVSTTHEIR